MVIDTTIIESRDVESVDMKKYLEIINDAIDKYFDSNADVYLDREAVRSSAHSVAMELHEEGRHGPDYIIGAAILGGIRRCFRGTYLNVNDFDDFFYGRRGKFTLGRSHEAEVADALLSDIMDNLDLGWRKPLYISNVRRIAKPIRSKGVLK